MRCRNGYIEFHELKAALSEKAVAEAKRVASRKTLGNDVAGSGEEHFDQGMRNNAAERDAADGDSDHRLSFDEFCVFLREREEGEFTEEELKIRFELLDPDGSGWIEMHEYLQWSLRDALSRSSQRIIDLFKVWDEDKSGAVDKREFFKAVRALGFDVEQSDTDAVFKALDADGSGMLEYAELNDKLRNRSVSRPNFSTALQQSAFMLAISLLLSVLPCIYAPLHMCATCTAALLLCCSADPSLLTLATCPAHSVGSELTKRNLKRAPTQRSNARDAKLTAKNVNQNYKAARAVTLPQSVKLVAKSGVTVQEQLSLILTKHQVKLIDLFREWDDDGNGKRQNLVISPEPHLPRSGALRMKSAHGRWQPSFCFQLLRARGIGSSPLL